jgi:sugar phosphate isomerase/epimerase
MQDLKPLEPGVMFWAGRDDLVEMKSLGVRCGQLGIPGAMDLDESAAAVWRDALRREGFTLVTVFASYIGESYADIPAVARTVGFVPKKTREERERRTRDLSDFAAALGVGSIACHIGCVPEDPGHPDYAAVREMVRRVCDHAGRRGQTFALETGQERPEVLSRFLTAVDRPNVRINFDPANMVLYGTGEPIAALRALAPHVVSVHCKDACGPPANVPGALGTERPLGLGSVGIERFVQTLREIGFRGPLNIEREAENQQERLSDIRQAVRLLTRLVGSG